MKKKIKKKKSLFFALLLFTGIFTGFIYAEDVDNGIVLDNNSVNENVENGTKIGTFSDMGNVGAEFVLEDGFVDNFRFKIKDKKDLIVNTPSIDFERVSIYSIKVIEKSTNKEKILNINVNDLNEKVKNLKITSTKVDLSKDIDRIVGNFIVEDDGEDGVYTYNIVKDEESEPSNTLGDDNTTATSGDGNNNTADVAQVMQPFLISKDKLIVKDEEGVVNGQYNVKVRVNDGKFDFIKEFSITISGGQEDYNNDDTGIDWGSILKNATIGFAVCFAQGAIFSGPAQAIDIASVPVNNIGSKMVNGAGQAKECGLDYAANQLKNSLIHGILKSTTEWVKGGFEGKPTFISDPNQFLQDATDKFVGDIISHSESTKFLCSNFKIPLKFAINLKFYGKGSKLKTEDVKAPECTLSSAEQNIKNALGDVKNFYTSDGKVDTNKYWNTFLKKTTNSNNNVYGSYIKLSSDLEKAIDKKNADKKEDIQRGEGFMSIEKCEGEKSGTYSQKSSNKICAEKLKNCLKLATTDSAKKSCNRSAKSCASSSLGKKKCKYVTPGKVISDQVSDVLGMENENLLLADEFDELISALVTQLMEKIFNAFEGGLAGVDSSDLEEKDKNIDVEKLSLLKMYNPEAFVIEEKIRKENVEVHKRFLNYILDLKDKWIIRKNDLESDSKKWRQSEDDPKYSVLTKDTMDSVISKIESKYEQAVKGMSSAEKSLKNVSERKKKAEAAVKLIEEAKSQKDLSAIFEGEGALEPSKIGDAFGIYMSKSRKMEKTINGHITDYSLEKPIKKGGLISAEIYLTQFNKSRGELTKRDYDGGIIGVTEGEIEDSLSWYGIASLAFDYENILILDNNKTYEINELIEDYNYTATNFNTSSSDNDMNIVDIDKLYNSILTEDTPSASPDANTDNWKDFFISSSEIILDRDRQKDVETGKYYLPYVSSVEKHTDYNPDKQSNFDWYSYDTYNLSVDHYAVYPDGLGDNVVNGIKGQGQYKTTVESDGKSWESYKVYIPPFAKKVALLFKGTDDKYKNYLYRMHLTFGEKVNHKDVKSLKYVDVLKPENDEKYSSLKELFENEKTALVNITDYTGDIGDELEPGINNMGVVFGEDIISKYVPISGGWLYFDIIKDNNALGKRLTEKTKIDILYYIDFDKDSEKYKKWKNDSVLYTREKDTTVVNINTEKVD